MFRNTYDGDNTTFSPQGRLHQVEYAMEAVKQGSAAVGLRSKKHVVLLTLKRSTGELASYQKKLIRIDDHMGVAIAGLTSDARVLSDFMRQQAMSSKMIYARPIPIGRAVNAISDKAQYNTQMYGRRPYGVGFLVAGYDESGPHLYEFAPSGVTYEYYAMAIGARSQSAKTYLESHYESFPDCTLDELIMHGLNALRDTLQQDKDLSTLNTSIATVGPASISALLSQSLVAQNPPKASLSSTTSTTASGTNVTELFTPITSLQQTAGPTEDFIKDKFTVIEGEDLKSYLDRMEKREEPGAAGEAEEGDMQADAPQDGSVPAAAAGGDGAEGSAGTGNMQTD